MSVKGQICHDQIITLIPNQQTGKQHRKSHTKCFVWNRVGLFDASCTMGYFPKWCMSIGRLHLKRLSKAKDNILKERKKTERTTPSWRLGQTLWHCVGWGLGAGGCRPPEMKHGPRWECCFLSTETQARWAFACSTTKNCCFGRKCTYLALTLIFAVCQDVFGHSVAAAYVGVIGLRHI